jgi:hypothetical protein
MRVRSAGSIFGRCEVFIGTRIGICEVCGKRLDGFCLV